MKLQENVINANEARFYRELVGEALSMRMRSSARRWWQPWVRVAGDNQAAWAYQAARGRSAHPAIDERLINSINNSTRISTLLFCQIIFHSLTICACAYTS